MQGKLEEVDLWEPYRKHVLKFLNLKRKIRVAIDSMAHDFPELEQVDEIWLVITGSWETENVLFFAELCPNVMDRRLMLDLNTSVTMALGA